MDMRASASKPCLLYHSLSFSCTLPMAFKLGFLWLLPQHTLFFSSVSAMPNATSFNRLRSKQPCLLVVGFSVGCVFV